MLGLLALGLTTIMIYNLVKNALLGKQISKDDTYTGVVEVIIPITENSEFFLAEWQNSVNYSRLIPGQLKVHLLIDRNHPLLTRWQEQLGTSPYFEVHSYPMRPSNVEPIIWMIDQISPKIQGQVVIIGDSELVPTEQVILSIAKSVVDKKRSYFVVPQTAKTSTVGEAIAVLNPTLAYTSFFGFKKLFKNFTHPLLSISQGWMAMNHDTFKELKFKTSTSLKWKEFVSRQWDDQKKSYHLAFGEKHLIRYYPTNVKAHTAKLRAHWQSMGTMEKKTGIFLYAIALFLWSFPVVCFLTHPFWSIASFFLLILYRFFSKIVFQDSWVSIMLHPIGCLFWIGTLIWYGIDVSLGKAPLKQIKE